VNYLRDWLSEFPYDGDIGRQVKLTVEIGEAGEEVDCLILFSGETPITSWSGTLERNLRLADEWARGRVSAKPMPCASLVEHCQ
jgi:hypothetical protein